MTDILTIAEVARRSGVAASALRFYEQRGLIRSERTGSGHRRFPRAALRRVAFIVFAQKIGLSLEEISAELAKLPSNRVSGTRRLGAALIAMDRARGRADRRAAAAEGGADRVHRVRLPVAADVPPGRIRRIASDVPGQAPASGSATRAPRPPVDWCRS